MAFAYILRGRGGTAISRAAGSGVLDPGSLQEKARLAAAIEAGRVAPPGIAAKEAAEAGSASGETDAASAAKPEEPKGS